MLKRVTMAIACLLVSTLEAHKILMSGSLEQAQHKYFEQIALGLANNEEYDNQIYLLQHDIEDRKNFQIIERQKNFYTIQVPRLPEDAERTKELKMMNRLLRFAWDSRESEEENYVGLDEETAKTFFGDQDFLEFLRDQEFHVGIGGSSFTDSLLFRYLDLKFLKLEAEDIESYQMQFKHDMPVLLSAYPSSQAYANFDYDDLPHTDSQVYRWKMLKGYQYNRFFSRRGYMQRMRDAIPSELHAKLIDAFDQDHAMILGEGTKAGIFQSIMMKPPNIQPVYPMRYENKTATQEIHLDAEANGKVKTGPVIIFNTETLDPRSALYAGKNMLSVDTVLAELAQLESTLGGADYDVVVLSEESKERYFRYSQENAPQFTRYAIADTLNVDFDKETKDHIEAQGRKVLWLSQCTQQNFLTAIEKFRASIIGFANEDLNPTQTFNCHKLLKFNVGRPIQMTEAQQSSSHIREVIKDAVENHSSIQKDVTFYYRLLAEDERLSKMDLNYWIDYVYLFGVKDLIPLYDHMDPVTYRNWDVYCLLWSIAFVVAYLWYKVISFCLSCCRGGAKVKSD